MRLFALHVGVGLLFMLEEALCVCVDEVCRGGGKKEALSPYGFNINKTRLLSLKCFSPTSYAPFISSPFSL